MKTKIKIIAAFLKYDYGIKNRGESLEKKLFYPALQANAAEVIPFWLEENGFPNDLDSLQEKLIIFCKHHSPDLIFFILMKNEIYLSTLEKLKKDFYTINWFADDQWRFDIFSKHIAKALSGIVTVDKYSIPYYKELGCQNVILTQWATCDYLPNLQLDKIKYQYDISFIGSKNIVRHWYIDFLNKSGIKVVCFGAGWENGRVSYKQMQEIILTSKINLNLSNSIPKDYRFYIYLLKKLIHNLVTFKIKLFFFYGKKILSILVSKKKIEQIKARNFEIPGLGGFQLSQYALELDDYYIIGQEIVVFSSIDELLRQIKYYKVNEKIRRKILESGYIRTKKYTYIERIRAILNEISNKKSEFSG